MESPPFELEPLELDPSESELLELLGSLPLELFGSLLFGLLGLEPLPPPVGIVPLYGRVNDGLNDDE